MIIVEASDVEEKEQEGRNNAVQEIDYIASWTSGVWNAP